MEANLPYKISCADLLICSQQDHAGSGIRYNKELHKNTGIPIVWIQGAGHNSNIDALDKVNALIEDFVNQL